MTFPFPKDTRNGPAWSVLMAQYESPADVAIYLNSLYEQEYVRNFRHQIICIAQAYLMWSSSEEYTFNKSLLGSQFKCAHPGCGMSTVADQGHEGRLLKCGHLFHTFCLAKKDKCPVCNLDIIPPVVSFESAIRYSECNAASELLKSKNKSEKIKEMKITLKEQEHHVMQEHHIFQYKVLTSEDEDVIVEAAKQVFIEQKSFLKQRAMFVLEKYISKTTNNEFTPVCVPIQCGQKHTKRKATSSVAQGNSNFSNSKKGRVVTSNIEDDSLLKEDQKFENNVKSLKFQNRTCLITAFNSKCCTCKRTNIQNRSIVVSKPSGQKGFECSKCAFDMTSVELYDVLQVSSLLGNDVASSATTSTKPSVDITNFFTT